MIKPEIMAVQPNRTDHYSRSDYSTRPTRMPMVMQDNDFVDHVIYDLYTLTHEDASFTYMVERLQCNAAHFAVAYSPSRSGMKWIVRLYYITPVDNRAHRLAERSNVPTSVEASLWAKAEMLKDMESQQEV